MFLASPDPLRRFLATHCVSATLLRFAAADYERDADRIYEEFKRNLETGEYAYAGDGNPGECCLLHLRLANDGDPWEPLFAVWWLGVFVSRDNWTYVENVGVGHILKVLVHASSRLGRQAAHAAIPFLAFLRECCPTKHAVFFTLLFRSAERALQAIETLDLATANAGRLIEFYALADRYENGEMDDY